MEKVVNIVATDDTTETEDVHSIDQTKAVLEELRTYIKEDTEGDLDMYTKLTVATPDNPFSAVSVKLDDDGSGLSYTLTITPIED